MGQHKIGFNTAVSVVIANMIGTGVFTSLGFQVLDMQNGFALLALWVVGGILALCGALCYGELGAAFPQNGGEFNYLTKLFHPALGFLSGWVSVTVGFAAPIAAAAMALSKYVGALFPTISALPLAVGVILVITIIHSFNLKSGGAFQRAFTLVKVLVILVFISAGILFGESLPPENQVSFFPSSAGWSEIFSPVFAASLVYVTYAYSGWNAASYLTGEIKDAQKNLPRSLIGGTLVVTVIYTALHFVFLRTTPIHELKGQIEIGYLSANHIFGVSYGKYMSLAIAVLLISTISAMILAGPRVMQSMGNEIPSLKFLATANKNNVPWLAISIQSLIAISLVLTTAFDSLINYVGFTLNLFTFITVCGIFKLRYKMKHIPVPFKSPLFPLPPILFLTITGWVLWSVFKEKTEESLWGLLTVGIGLAFYYISIYASKKKNEQ